MSESEKIALAKAFQEKLPILECPMCHNKKFKLADGYFANVIQGELKSIKLDGKYIPSAAVVCDNCGFISFHALGSLGLLDKVNG